MEEERNKGSEKLIRVKRAHILELPGTHVCCNNTTPRTAPHIVEQSMDMVRKGLSPPIQVKGKTGGDIFSDCTISTLPDKEVQALMTCLHVLNTSSVQAHQDTHPTHEYYPEAKEVQWEAVYRGQVPHPDVT